MKVNHGQIEERESVRKPGGVVISPNLIRETERLDRDGNVIDPRTKQIIKRKDEE